MILGIGTDILHLPRIVRLMRRRGHDLLARRILSGSESKEWDALNSGGTVTAVGDGKGLIERRERYLAVRWAVKEAAYKALYPSIRPTWKQVSYRSVLERGHSKPLLEFSEYDGEENGKEWKRRIQSIKLHASVSHDGEYVVAYVVAERELKVDV